MKDKPKSKKNPKLDKFLKEINDIGTKYQYRIIPVLHYSPNGIVPNLQIVDTVPEDEKSGNGKLVKPNKIIS